MLKKLFFALLVTTFLVPAFALAFDIPSPEGYVLDQTEVLSYEEEMALELEIQEIEESTTAEIGILIIDTTGDEVISELAFEVGNNWGVGKKTNDNGLMILVALEDRAWFMATGYGLEGTLPDAITKRIAEKNFPSYFRAADYAGGLSAALRDIRGYLENDPTVVASLDTPATTSDDSSAFWIVVILALAVAKSIWVGASKKKKRLLHAGLGNGFLLLAGLLMLGPAPAAVITVIAAIIDLIIMAGPSSGGGSGSSGSGSSWSSSSSSSSWGSSSGGSSFGGGSFGGGGSGGRW